MTTKQKLRAELKLQRDKLKEHNAILKLVKSEMKHKIELPKYICKCCGTHNNIGHNFKTRFTCDSCYNLLRHFQYLKRPIKIVGRYSEWMPKVHCKCCGSSEHPIVTGKVCDVCLGRQIKLSDGYLKWHYADHTISVVINNTIYSSIAEASRTLGISYSSIYKAAIGLQESTHGLVVDVVPRPLQIEDIENYRPSGSFKE